MHDRNSIIFLLFQFWRICDGVTSQPGLAIEVGRVAAHFRADMLLEEGQGGKAQPCLCIPALQWL